VAIWLLFQLIDCITSSKSNNTEDEKILSEKEAKNLLINKLEQLSLTVHRKEEGDRIRKKRQYDLNYQLPGDDDQFSSIALKTIVKEIEPLELTKQRELFRDASSWSTVENPSNITLFWTKKQYLNPYNNAYDRTILNYATLNPDLKKLQLHYSAPDLIQYPSSIAIKSKQFNYHHRFFVVLYFVGDHYEIVTYKFDQSSMIRTQSLSFVDQQVDFDLIHNEGNVYLATSVNQGVQGEVRLYKWNRIQFDLVADQKSESLADVDSLKLFKMSGTVYIATSTISKDSKIAILFSYQDSNKIYDSLRLIQKLKIDNGITQPLIRSSKIESFSVNGNHYLVFIGPYDCKIFWWLKSQFIEFQKLPNTAFARDIDISYLPSNEAIISLVSYQNDLVFYTESVNGEFIATFTRRFYTNRQQIKSASLVPFRKMHYFVFFTFVRSQQFNYASPIGDYQPIYHLNLTQIKSYKERKDPLMNCLDRLSYNIKKSELNIGSLKQRTSDVWVRNRDQVIRAPVFIHGTTQIRSPTKIGFMKIKSNSQAKEVIKAVDIVDNLNRLQQRIGQYQQEVDTNLVLKGPTNQNIQSPVSFIAPLGGNNVIVNEMNSMRLRINNVSLSDLTYNTLRKSGDQVILAPFTFINNLTANHVYLKRMNGLNLNDVLLTQSKIPQNVTGRYEFNNLLVKGNIELQDTINDINLKQLARFNSPFAIQIVTGDKLFNLIDFKAGVQVSGLVNKGDVRNLARNAIKLNSNKPQVCLGRFVFTRNIVSNKLDVLQPINDRVDIDEMLKYGLRREGEQKIQGNVRLNSLVTVNSMKVDGLVNNLNIETDLLNKHHNQVFDGELIFRQPITMLNNLNAFMVNSINFTNEIVYRNHPRPQHVIAHKTFDQDIFINNSLSMRDAVTIDYVDPSELVRHSLENVKRAFGSVTFDSLRVRGNVQVNRLNDILINELKTKYWIKNYRQVIDVPVVVKSPVRIQRLGVERLNSNLFPSDFVVNKPNTEQLITGSKAFVNAAVLNGSFITSTNTKVNGLNLNRLDSRIVQNLQLINKRDNSTIPDFIGGFKKFQTLEVQGNLYVNRLNGMRLENDLLLRNSVNEQIVTGSKRFENNSLVTVRGQVDVGDGLYVRNSINRLNLTDWLHDVVLKGIPVIINRFIENKQFLNRVDTRELNLFGQLSGINFTHLLNRAVYLDERTSDINVPIIFNDLVQFDKVRLLGRLNGLDLRIYEGSLIYRRPKINQRNQALIITGPTNIAGTLTVESNLKSAFPLNTINLGELQSRMLSKSRLNVVSAPFVFEHDLKANQFNLVNPLATINNVNPKEFVLLGGNVTIPGRLIVEDALDVVNSLNVQSGLVNQFNINELYTNSVNRLGDVRLGGNYGGDVVFKYLDVKGNLHTKDKLLDDIHLENEYKNKVIDANNIIETPLIFTDPVSVGNLVVRNRINDVRFDFILQDAVLKSVPQVISSPKMFTHDVVPRNKFTVHNLFNITGLLNKARLDELNRVLLRRTIGFNLNVISPKYFNKPVHFERDLQVLGRVNRLRIPNDLVLSNTNELINSTIVFKQPVEFIGQLDLGTYNGYSVRNSFVDRIDLNRANQEQNAIRSQIIFNDKVVIGELVVLRSINGIPINLLLPANGSTANLLKGKFVFDGNVRIDGDLNIRTNVLNNVNLHQLATQSVRINSFDYLPGRVIMDRRFTFNHTQLNKKLNGINIRRFHNFYLDKQKRQENYFRDVMNDLNRKDQRLSTQVDSAFGRRSYLEYFENYDEFDSLDSNGRELIFDRFLTSPYVMDSQFDGDYIMQPTIDHLTAWRIVNRKQRNTKNANSYCDHYETFSYSLNEYDDLILQEEKIVHRAFPAFKLTFRNNNNSTYQTAFDDDENTFYLWSNTTGCHLRANPYERYARENIPFEVTLLYTSQFTEIGKEKRRINEPHIHKDVKKSAIGRLDNVSAVMEDARFFTDKNNHHYAFVAFSYSKVLAHGHVNSTLFEFNQKKNKWFIRQQVLSEGAVAVDIVHYYPPNSMQWYGERTQYQRITLMAIANRLTKYDQSRRNVVQSSVYAFDDKAKEFKLIALLPTYSPKSVLFVPIYKGLKYENSTIVREAEHEDLFLIYANEKLRYYDECSTQEDLTLERSGSSRSSLFNQGVSIYRASRNSLNFTLYQQLDIVGSITLDKFYLPSNQAYIVIGSKILNKTFIYYYNTSNGQFVLVQTISTPSVENVKIFWSKSGNLYLAIASSKQGASKRLKAVINGPNPIYLRSLFQESYYH